MIDLTPQYSANTTGLPPDQIERFHLQVQLGYYKALAETFAELLSDNAVRQGIQMVTTPPATESGLILP